MARRGRKRAIKLNFRTDTAKSVLSVLFILAGGLSFVSFLAPSYSLNARIQDVIRGLFGVSAILLGPIFVILGLVGVVVYLAALFMPWSIHKPPDASPNS